MKKKFSGLNKGYEDLANAIIVQAVEDYRRYPPKRCAIARFFLSEWFTVLSNTSGQDLLNKLQEEVKQKKEEGKE